VLTKGWEAGVEGGQGVTSNGEWRSRDKIIGSFVADTQKKNNIENICQPYEPMQPFTTDSHEARTFTRPNTAIRAYQSTQKRCLKTSLE